MSMESIHVELNRGFAYDRVHFVSVFCFVWSLQDLPILQEETRGSSAGRTTGRIINFTSGSGDNCSIRNEALSRSFSATSPSATTNRSSSDSESSSDCVVEGAWLDATLLI